MKKCLSILLVLAMLLTVLPVSAFAAEKIRIEDVTLEMDHVPILMPGALARAPEVRVTGYKTSDPSFNSPPVTFMDTGAEWQMKQSNGAWSPVGEGEPHYFNPDAAYRLVVSVGVYSPEHYEIDGVSVGEAKRLDGKTFQPLSQSAGQALWAAEYTVCREPFAFKRDNGLWRFAPELTRGISSQPMGGSALKDKLVGGYTADIGTEKVNIFVTVIGGVVLLEYASYDKTEGYFITSSLEELWPDNSALLEGNGNAVSGLTWTSSGFGPKDQFTEQEIFKTIRLTPGGDLAIKKGNDPEQIYLKDYSLKSHHNSENFYLDMLKTSDAYKPSEYLDGVAGTWYYQDADCAIHLILRENGTFEYACKADAMPMEVLLGGWILDEKTDRIIGIGEHLGSGQEPQSFQLCWSNPGGTELLLIDDSGSALLPVFELQLPFTDVKETHWFYNDVAYAYKRGLISGVTATRFGADVPTTRAMIVTILYRMEGYPEVKGRMPFSDVPANQYFADPVLWASQNKIVMGMEDGTYRPNNKITREQLAAILCRYAQYKGLYNADDCAMLIGFRDMNQISSWAENPMSWAVGTGLIGGINGTDGRYIKPRGFATRCQVAAILHRLCDNFGL